MEQSKIAKRLKDLYEGAVTEDREEEKMHQDLAKKGTYQYHSESAVISDEILDERRYPKSNVLLAGVIAGSIAGFLTNAPEVLAVNRQANPNFKVKDFLRRKNALSALLFKGSGFRTIYYGSQAALFFYLLEELKIYLKCEEMDE